MELVRGRQVRIVCLGEGMIEERCCPQGEISRHYGGDTLNTAIHLARLGHNVRFATALGRDARSVDLRQQWESENVDTSLILTHPDRESGRYTIKVDTEGERTFSYDRTRSAAREMFVLCLHTNWQEEIAHADVLVFSLISLAVLAEAHREKLIALAGRVQENGGRVIFDGNWRSQLWESAAVAKSWRDRAAGLCDIGLPTLDDERALGSGNAASVAAHWSTLGCGEVLVKMGEEGCLLPSGELLAPPQRLSPIDTSGAGDAFNAGYLSARLRGLSPEEAALAGHRLAGWVVMRSGAIPPRDSMAPYQFADRR